MCLGSLITFPLFCSPDSSRLNDQICCGASNNIYSFPSTKLSVAKTETQQTVKNATSLTVNCEKLQTFNDVVPSLASGQIRISENCLGSRGCQMSLERPTRTAVF